MRIISFNANGIRSAVKKGFFSWLSNKNADVVCLQEIKAQADQLSVPEFCPIDFHCYYSCAEKKGYSGVAIYTKHEPDRIQEGFGWKEGDCEGRYIQADFGNLSIISLYMPSGTSGEHRQQVKYLFMDEFLGFLKQLKQTGRQYIICGDWNIAHKAIDLKNWKTNQKTSGFLPPERAWMDVLFEEVGFIDGFRVINQEPDQYTWWTQRSVTARERNIGWRIDYQVITPDLKEKVQAAEIYSAEVFSDHAPLIMDYAL